MTTPRQARLDEIAAALRIPKVSQEVLDAGSNHPYSCRCETCWRWWKLMGPSDDGGYGPFTEEEIRADTYARSPAQRKDNTG